MGDGRQKFILKESTEGISAKQVPRTKYSAFAYQVDTSILDMKRKKKILNIKYSVFVYQVSVHTSNVTTIIINILFTQIDDMCFKGLHGLGSRRPTAA